MAESEFQKALIGSALVPADRSPLDAIFEAGITRNNFTGKCRTVWLVVEELFATGSPVEPIKVAEKTKDYEFLESCIDACPSAAFAQHNITCVQRETLLRQCRELLLDAEDILTEGTTDNAEELVADIQKRWLDLGIQREQSNEHP